MTGAERTPAAALSCMEVEVRIGAKTLLTNASVGDVGCIGEAKRPGAPVGLAGDG